MHSQFNVKGVLFGPKPTDLGMSLGSFNEAQIALPRFILDSPLKGLKQGQSLEQLFLIF